MAQDNVEAVRGAIEAFNRRDFPAIAALCADDFEFVSVFTAVDADGATYRGANAWEEYSERMDETWVDWRVEDVRLKDAGDDQVVAGFRLAARGKQSGMPVEQEVGAIYRFRDGKLWRMRSYLDPSDALKAVARPD